MTKKNKGTGAGGAQTNKNGLNFEDKIYLKKWIENIYKIKDISKPKTKTDLFEIYDNDKIIGYYGRQGQIYNILEQIVDYIDKNFIKSIFSKKINPDGFIISLNKKHITIFEKKWQQGSGSVDEKIQTAPFKLEMFNKLLKDSKFNISYEYILSDWFNQIIYRNIKEYYESMNNINLWIENTNLKDLDIKNYLI